MNKNQLVSYQSVVDVQRQPYTMPPIKPKIITNRKLSNPSSSADIYNNAIQFKLSRVNNSDFSNVQLVEDLICHNVNYLRMYKLKIDQKVKSTMQTFQKNHLEEHDMNVPKPFNKMEDHNYYDSSSMILEKYKNDMIKYQKRTTRFQSPYTQCCPGLSDRIYLKPSSAVKNVKRKLKSSRRNVIQEEQPQVSQNFSRNSKYLSFHL